MGLTPLVRRIAGLAAIAVLWAACRPDADPTPRASPAPDTGFLLFLDAPPDRHDSTLSRIGLGGGPTQTLARLPTQDAYAAPGGRLVAVVTSGAGGGEDFATDPRLGILDVASGRTTEAGSGFSPLWAPSGDRIAFLRPVEARGCAGEECVGEVEIFVHEVATGSEERLVDRGRWGLLAWAGERLLLSDLTDTSSALVVEPDGGATPMQLPPSEVWDTSPDGRWLLGVDATGPYLVALDAGIPAGEPARMALGGGRLVGAAWSPNSDRVAAAVLGGGRSRLVTFAPGEPARSVEGLSRPAGPVFWTQDGRGLVAVVETADGRRFQALRCPADPSDACELLLSWRRGVVVLGTGDGP